MTALLGWAYPLVTGEANTSVEQMVDWQIVFMWRADCQTFAATVSKVPDDRIAVVGPTEVIGTSFAEFVTSAALEDGLSARGYVLDHSLVAALKDLADETAAEAGEFCFVGVQGSMSPMLTLMSPSGHVELVCGRNVLSPDGPSWGYSGSGPAEAAEMMLARAVGERATADFGLTKAFMIDVVAGLPSEFSLSASSVVDWYETRRPPLVLTDRRQIEVVTRALEGH